MKRLMALALTAALLLGGCSTSSDSGKQSPAGTPSQQQQEQQQQNAAEVDKVMVDIEASLSNLGDGPGADQSDADNF